MIQMARSMACELGADAVRVNSISPGKFCVPFFSSSVFMVAEPFHSSSGLQVTSTRRYERLFDLSASVRSCSLTFVSFSVFVDDRRSPRRQA